MTEGLHSVYHNNATCCTVQDHSREDGSTDGNKPLLIEVWHGEMILWERWTTPN